MKFRKAKNVKGYWYWCSNCGRQLDYYEYLKFDGLCENCNYSKW